MTNVGDRKYSWQTFVSPAVLKGLVLVFGSVCFFIGSASVLGYLYHQAESELVTTMKKAGYTEVQIVGNRCFACVGDEGIFTPVAEGFKNNRHVVAEMCGDGLHILTTREQ